MHPNGGYFVSLPKEKVKLLNWCEGDVLSVDIVKDLFTIRKVSARQYRHAESDERIEDLGRPERAPDVPNQAAVSKAPAESETPAVVVGAQESEKTVNVMAAPATKEHRRDAGSLSGEGYHCRMCGARVASYADNCHRCGARTF